VESGGKRWKVVEKMEKWCKVMESGGNGMESGGKWRKVVESGEKWCRAAEVE